MYYGQLENREFSSKNLAGKMSKECDLTAMRGNSLITGIAFGLSTCLLLKSTLP